jgi:hypothetical protein
MRIPMWARWATCALAASILVPVAAASGRRSLDHCTSFTQVDESEEVSALTVSSTCSIPIDCSVSWRVVCAPDSKKRRAVHRGSVVFAFPTTDTKTARASAEICGDDSFVIDSVQWSCQPNKD